MIYNELILLYTPLIKKNTTVSTDPDKHSKIKMNVNMTFTNTPCFLLSVEVFTSVNHLEHDELSKQLTWTHVDKNGKIIETFKKDPSEAGGVFDSVDLQDDTATPALIKSFFDDGLRCNVEGTVQLTKVTG